MTGRIGNDATALEGAAAEVGKDLRDSPTDDDFGLSIAVEIHEFEAVDFSDDPQITDRE